MSERAGWLQDVHVTGGFGYGVVGADIHVFGDGLPVYVLQRWRPPAAPDPHWLREVPSRMLNARHAVVAFTGRDGEMAELREWRDGGVRFALRWLHGPGGIGKTRLADRLAAESVADGWVVVVATHGPASVLPPPGSQDLRVPDGAPGVVLIVDYADRWPLAHLTWLLSNALLHQLGVPARILLLARSTDAWPALRAAVSNHQASTSSQAVGPLPDDPGGRARMFTVAWDSFAIHYGLRGVGDIAVPDSLHDPDFGLTLAVHMAAVVAVDARSRGLDSPDDVAGLTIYLLDREHLHWAAMAGDAGHEIAATTRSYRTPPNVMHRLAFTAAGTGPVARAVGAALVDRQRLPNPTTQALEDHALCYPPADPIADTVLEPIYPDRLAEDLLALCVPGHGADYPSQPWAPAIVRQLLEPDAVGGEPSAYVSRLVMFLAQAAQRWPHVGPACLFPVLRRDPTVAISAGSAALSAIAGIGSIDADVLASVDACLPETSHVDLDVGASAVARAMLTHRLRDSSGPVEQASWHTKLSLRQARAGDRAEALSSARAACELLRAAPAGRGAERDYELATALNVYGNLLRDIGQPDAAQSAVEEAVSICRRRVAARPDKFEQLLALSLSNLAGQSVALGRLDEAVATASEALALLRDVATGDIGDDAGLGDGLLNLGAVLAQQGRPLDAVAMGRNAYGIFSRLAAAEPTTYLPEQAHAASELGAWLLRAGHRADAVVLMREAVTVRRDLVRRNRDRYLPELAGSVHNLGNALADVGALQDALASSAEAVSIYRRLAEALPAAYVPRLAVALQTHVTKLASLGRPDDALVAAEECIALRRRLAAAHPQRYEPDLANELGTLGNALANLGRDVEALAFAEEAAQIARRTARMDPQAHSAQLAVALNNLALRLGGVGRTGEAVAVAVECVALRRQLGARLPLAEEPNLAGSLNNLSLMLVQSGRRAEAIQPLEEAVSIYQRLSSGHPGAFQPDLAMALVNLGAQLAYLGRARDAFDRIEEALDLFNQLASRHPEAYQYEVGVCHSKLLDLRWELGDPDNALRDGYAACEIMRRLAARHPLRYGASLASTLAALGVRLVEVGQPQAALSVSAEAIFLYGELDPSAREAILPDVANALISFTYVRLICGVEPDDALAAASEAVAIHEHLATTNPTGYGEELIGAYLAYAQVLDALDRPAEAQEIRQRAAALTGAAPAVPLDGAGHRRA